MRDNDCSENLTNALHDAQGRVRDQRGQLCNSEADTRNILIEPILMALGWDTMDARQVKREYNPYPKRDKRNRRKLDYVLLVDDTPCVLVEAKKLNPVDAKNPIEGAKDAIENVYCKDTPYTGIATDGNTWSIWQDKSWIDIRIDTEEACEHMSVISKDSIDEQAVGQIGTLIEKFDPDTPEEYNVDMESRKNTNKAVQLFSEFVVENKDKFRDNRDFHQMLRAYLNILMYAETKTTIKKVLVQFGLDDYTKNQIIELSRVGKFVGITRTLREQPAAYRKEFLDLIETFVKTDRYDELLEKFKTFVARTRSGNMAALTGILSSLRPEHFIVYNKRSSLPLKDTIYKDFANANMSKYWDFNNVYRKISKKTGKSLVELDVIANDRYWDRLDSEPTASSGKSEANQYETTPDDPRDHTKLPRSAI